MPNALLKRVRRAAGFDGATGAQVMHEQAALANDAARAGGRVKAKADQAAHRLDLGADKARDLAKRARAAGAALGIRGVGERVARAADVAAAVAAGTGDAARIGGAAVQGAAAGAVAGAGAEGSRQSARDFFQTPTGLAVIFGGMVVVLRAGAGNGGRR